MSHKHEQHIQDIRSDPFAPHVGSVAVLDASRYGPLDAPLSVEFTVPLEVAQYRLPEHVVVPDISWLEQRFEPAFQREFDVAFPVVGEIAQKALAFLVEVSEQVSELTPVGDVWFRDLGEDHECACFA